MYTWPLPREGTEPDSWEVAGSSPAPVLMSRDPNNSGEWQDAVDAAHACLTLDAARLYGLVTGGPGVNVGRCEDILNRGRRRGVEPRPDAVERFLSELTP